LPALRHDGAPSSCEIFIMPCQRLPKVTEVTEIWKLWGCIYMWAEFFQNSVTSVTLGNPWQVVMEISGGAAYHDVRLRPSPKIFTTPWHGLPKVTEVTDFRKIRRSLYMRAGFFQKSVTSVTLGNLLQFVMEIFGRAANHDGSFPALAEIFTKSWQGLPKVTEVTKIWKIGWSLYIRAGFFQKSVTSVTFGNLWQVVVEIFCGEGEPSS